MTDTTPGHFCPGCGAPQRAFARYPWYFCGLCLATATDHAGNRLRFANTDFGGGFCFSIGDDPVAYVCAAVTCRIADRPVIVHEARFGGVVAEPLSSFALSDAAGKVVNLRSATANLDGLRKITR